MTSAPKQWSRESLGRILSAIEAGKNFRCIEKPPEDGNPGVVKVSAVTWGTFDELESKTCPDPRLLNERYLIRPGDLLISRANTLELVGACVIVGSISRRLMLSDKILRLVMPEQLKRWVLWFLRSKAGRTQIEAKASGNQLSMRNIGQDGIRSIELPVAPPVEREQIVAAIESHFSRLDAATATLERVQRNLKRYRASVLKAAVEGRLVPTEAELAKKEGRSYEPASVLLNRILAERRRRWEEAELAKLKAKGKPPTDDRWKAMYEEPVAPDISDLPELPDGWCWTTVDVAGDVLLGRRKAPEYSGKNRPYLRVANVRDDRLDLSVVKEMPFDDEHFERHRLSPGDILVSEGQSPELIGQSAIFPEGLEPTCFQSTLHRFRAHQGVASPGFAQIAFRSHVKTGVFRRFASITTNIAHLVLNRFKVVPFPLPPLAEQARIVEVATRLLTLADHGLRENNGQLARIARLRQSILKLAFEGRLVGQDQGTSAPTAEDNPATMRRSASTDPSARR